MQMGQVLGLQVEPYTLKRLGLCPITGLRGNSGDPEEQGEYGHPNTYRTNRIDICNCQVGNANTTYLQSVWRSHSIFRLHNRLRHQPALKRIARPERAERGQENRSG